jgi:hypothetical protein
MALYAGFVSYPRKNSSIFDSFHHDSMMRARNVTFSAVTRREARVEPKPASQSTQNRAASSGPTSSRYRVSSTAGEVPNVSATFPASRSRAIM